MKELLFNEGQNLKEVLCEISEYIYHNPELGNQEFKSSEKLISFLEEHNFNYGVESKIDKGTTFYFEIDKDK